MLGFECKVSILWEQSTNNNVQIYYHIVQSDYHIVQTADYQEGRTDIFFDYMLVDSVFYCTFAIGNKCKHLCSERFALHFLL